MFPIFGLANKDGQPGLIGIAGKARAGKDTLGKYLCDEYRCMHYYFAKPIKEACRVMFQLTDDQIANKEVPIEPWGYSPRKMYQYIGLEVGRNLDPNVWVKNAELFVKSVAGHTVVITDVRFSNEALWIHNRGGVVINIVRGDNRGIEENSHASEHGITEDDFDLTIYNNGTIEDMCNEVTYMIQKGIAV